MAQMKYQIDIYWKDLNRFMEIVDWVDHRTKGRHRIGFGGWRTALELKHCNLVALPQRDGNTTFEFGTANDFIAFKLRWC
jgi:hypothetical protein